MTYLRAFRFYNFRLHILGQFVSLIGTWMQRVAISWLVYRLTNSAILLGFVSFLSLIPSLFLSPYAGSFADRHNKFTLVKVTQFALMLQAGTMALMVWLKWYSIPMICALSLIQGIISAFDNTGRQAMMSEIVPEKDDLPNAIALYSSAFNVARLLGPALAGFILSTIGEQACFFINFLSYIVVLLCLYAMRISRLPMPKRAANVWDELRDGYDYLKAAPDISSLIILLSCSSLMLIPFTTLLPVIASDLFKGNAVTFSWFESAGGVGALIGALYMATIKPGKPLSRTILIATSILSLGLILLAFSPKLNMAIFFTLLATLGLMIQTSAINTYIQTHSLTEMRGRVISYYMMAYQGVLPIGSLLVGFLAEKLGLEVTLAIEGFLGLAIIAVFYWYNKFRLNTKTIQI
jgi:MFS family permease